MPVLQVTSYGGVENLVYSQDISELPLEIDQARIKVYVAAVNPIDTKIRNGTGFAAKARQANLPWTLGYDLAGEIIELHHDYKGDFKIGDRVCGMVGFPLNAGAYTSEGVFKLNELVRIPDSCSYLSAGAVPLAGLTAYQALFDVGELKEGQTVIISAAAGGVGHLAVQLAKKAKARVLAIASKKNHAFLKSLGADDVADYENEECLRWQSEADLIIDLVGGQSAISNLSLLNINSRMVSVPTISYQSVKLAATNLSSEVVGMVVKNNIKQLKNILDLISAKELLVKVSQTFSLEEGAKAHELIESRHVVGKLVLLPNGNLNENNYE
jgi:NADPH2:quinone reductase